MKLQVDGSFGGLLRGYRLQRGWTQAELAERAGMSVEAVGALERGTRRTPWPGTVARLASALQLTTEEREVFTAAPRGSPGQVVDLLPHLASGAIDPSPGATTSDKAEESGLGDNAVPLVGRRDEMSTLTRYLAGTGPPMLLFHGEPGIGKSRLLWEAQQSAQGSGWTVLAGSCRRRDSEPFAPILTALRQYIGHQPDDSLRALLVGCAWLARLLPELMDGLAPPLPPWTVSPDTERRLIAESVIRFLGNIAGSGGVLIVLDDLQWAGSDAVELLTNLAHASSRVPLRILGAYRDSDVLPRHPIAGTIADLRARQMAAQHPLGPLAGQHVIELLDAIQDPGRPIESGVREQVLQRSGGVPLFVISFAQSWRSHAGVPDTVPEDIAESVRARIEPLSTRAHRVLTAAAVIGRMTSPKRVVETAGLPEDDVLDALEELCHARLLEQTASDGYRFVHDVIWEVVEAGMGAARRKVLHRRVAEALEREAGPAPVEQLALHYSRSDDRVRAVAWLKKAGDRAEAQHAYASAAGYYRDLLELLDELNQTEDVGETCERLGQSLHRSAQYDEALAILERAAREYRARGDREGELRSLALIGSLHAVRGTPDQGLARIRTDLDTGASHVPSPGLAQLFVAASQLHSAQEEYGDAEVASKRAVGIARASGDTRLRGNTLAEWGGNLVMVGRFDDALTVMQEATHLAEVAGDLAALCTAHRAMIGTYINKGDLVQARTAGDRAVEVAERLGDPEVMALAWASRALVTMLTGQWDLARDDLERALALARGIASAVTMRFALTGYGRYCLYTGDWEQAVRLFEEAITMDDQEVPAVQGFLADLDLATGHPFRARERLAPYYERTSRHLWINETRPVYARACLETGDLERAEALLTDHMVWVEQTGKRQGKVEGLRVRGILAARRGQWEDAARDFAEALTVARQMSMPYAQARILDAWGTMHDSRGESVRACTLLLESLTLFSRLGAQKDIERVNGHLVQLKAESLIPPSALRTAPGNTPRTTRP